MTIAGIWLNEYGSRMTLAIEHDWIVGTYESATGSTGQYRVVGWQGHSEPTHEAGQPVALAIEWHSVVPGAADPSWHWGSCLGGQLSVINGEERLILNHLLVATGPYPGVCERGTYLDKLTYRRAASQRAPGQPPLGADRTLKDPLAGLWTTRDGARIEAVVKAEPGGRYGNVEGYLSFSPHRWRILGFTDVNPASGNAGLQSVAIAAVDREHNRALAFGGWLDRNTKQMSLQMLTSYATRSSDTYMQTEIQALEFKDTPLIEPTRLAPHFHLSGLKHVPKEGY